MGTASWAVPTGVLAAIVGVGFIFFWFWFPRTWRRGVEAELSERGMAGGETEEDIAAGRTMAQGIIQRAIAREQAIKRGEKPSDEPIVPEGYYKARQGAPPAYV
jgi:hypothetical protein